MLGLTAGVVPTWIGAPSAAWPMAARTPEQRFAFSGSAAAGGVQITITVPEAPVTNTPIDGGGPTAQVVVDSIGTSGGYAAFPDPGQFTVGIPALAVGVLAGGAGGLPPLDLPSPPNYPFFVQSDSETAPEQSVGSGPFELRATSQRTSSEASAKAGFRTELAGNAALVTSDSSLIASDEQVVAKAVSDIQALTIGPLTIGEVKSLAAMTLNEDGSVTPSSALEIAGLRVGGVPVSLQREALVAGSATQPLAINATLAKLLGQSKISVEVVAAQEFPDRVVAPAVKITLPFSMPVAVPNFGQFSGTATLILGSATASLVGSQSPDLEDAASLPGIDDSAGSRMSGSAQPEASPGELNELAGRWTPSAELVTSLSRPRGSSDAATTPSLTQPAVSPEGVTALAHDPRSSGSSDVRASRSTARLIGSLDVQGPYLVAGAGAFLIVMVGQLIRKLGVKA